MILRKTLEPIPYGFTVVCLLLLLCGDEANGATIDKENGFESYESKSCQYGIGNVQMLENLLFRGQLTVTSQLSVLDSAAIRTKKISSVWTSKNADDTLFNEASRFPRLNRVHLETTSNTALLSSLSRNFPDLEVLSIRQKNQLKVEDIASLSRFKNLKFLELDCPLDQRNASMLRLPETLEFLNLVDEKLVQNLKRTPLNLPNLDRLSIHGGQVTIEFLDALSAPKLKTLDLFNTEISAGVLPALLNLEHLEDVYLDKSTVPGADAETLLSQPKDSITRFSKTDKSSEVDTILERFNNKNESYRKRQLAKLVTDTDIPAPKIITCEIVCKSHDGYEIKVGKQIGVLLTSKSLQPSATVDAYLILESSNRLLLTDDLRFGNAVRP